jgi:hypothetical protein
MKTLLIFTLTALSLIGCTNATEVETIDTQLPAFLLGEAMDNGLRVELLAHSVLSVRYCDVYVRLVRNGRSIKDAHVSIEPVMDMGMMQHSAPCVAPEEDPDANGLFKGSVMFLMSGTKEQWKLRIHVHDHTSDTEHSVDIPVDVAAGTGVKVLKNGTNYTVVTLLDHPWSVGINTVDIMVHASSDGMTFTPVADAYLAAIPTMPSMGHGSHGNVDPTAIGNGLYRGKVNLTMTGEWDIEVRHVENDVSKFSVHFPILVL